MVYRPTKQPPISRETTIENARKWLSIMRYGESGTVIQLQDDCEYRVDEILTNPSILKRFLGPYYRKFLLAYVPVAKMPFLEVVRTALLDLLETRKLKKPKDHLLVTSILTHIAREGFEIGLFITHVSELLNEAGFQSIFALERILQKSRNLSVILYVEKDITHPHYKVLTDKCSLLFDHIIKYPLYREKDVEQFFRYHEELWNFKLAQKNKTDIIRACGGYLWLISHLMRNYRDNAKYDLNGIGQDDLLIKKLEVVWDKFSQSEREILIQTVRQNLSDMDRSSHEFKYLCDIGILTLTANSVKLNIPLLSLVIQRETEKNRLTVAESRIFLGTKDITASFTSKERALLSLLLGQKGRIASRDAVGSALWKEKVEQMYSDWAIDRLVHRLRKKMNTLGIDSSLLKTSKRKGFIFG